MNFKSVSDVKQIKNMVKQIKWDSFHTSTLDKNGNKLVKFWFMRNCVLIICVKGSRDYNEDQWKKFYLDLYEAIEFTPSY